MKCEEGIIHTHDSMTVGRAAGDVLFRDNNNDTFGRC